jgi:hypothetical protein
MSSEGPRLDPVASSPSAARRWIHDRLGGYSTELVGTAQLLVTEVVTNAVIHARTKIDLSLITAADLVRVEVTDGIGVFPTAKDYGADAVTGRGIKLLDTLAAAWGADLVTGGKTVWFELADPAGGAGPAECADRAANADPVGVRGSADGEPDRSGQDLIMVRLLHVPLGLLGRAAEEYDALFREARLSGEGQPIPADWRQGPRPHRGPDRLTPAALVSLADELAHRYGVSTAAAGSALAAALERGEATTDLSYRFPADVGPACARYDQVLDEAESWCRDGRLLTLPPSVESTAVRRWLLKEFVRQAAGDGPISWPNSHWAGRRSE